MHTCTECYDTHPEDKLLNGKCPTCGSDVIKDATFDIHGLPMSRNNNPVQEDTMTIHNDIETYLHFSREEGDNYGIVPFTGMVGDYLLAAINAGIEAPFYNATTDVESLYYANVERNEHRINFWLRANGGIDAWFSWDDNQHTIECQINPRFDVEDQLHDMLANMGHLYTSWELRYIGYRFNTAFKGHDFMVCQGDWVPDTSDKPQNFRPNCPSCDALYNDYMEDLYDEEMMRRAENEPFTLHDEFMELDEFTINDKKETNMWGNMTLEDICTEKAQEVGWELYGWWNFQINLWRWFIANETDTEAKAIVSKAIHRFSLSNAISIEEEELHQTLREWEAEDDGPVEGVDSHAYYGPMTTLTNYEEAQRDREFD